MFCTECGTNITDDSRFCRSCGKTLGGVSTGSGTAAAPAPAPIPTPPAPSTAVRKRAANGTTIFGVLVALFIVWYVVRANVGSQGTNQAIAAAVHAPITLKNEVENIPANSWKAVALNLPYNGSLNVSLAVVRGNPLDVLLVRADQLETIQKEQWSNVQVFTDFSATKTKTYRRDAQLAPGGYYLVLRDTSLGILSESASDISVKVELNP